MRILVVNPALVRLNSLGACEQDRLRNLDNLRRLGHDVHLITGFMPYQKRDDVEAFYAARGIEVRLQAIRPPRSLQRWTNMAQWDGMAWEYAEPGFRRAMVETLTTVQPDLVWCHGSYVWSPALLAQQRGLPSVVRSVNYEPMQHLHENRRSLTNTIRYLGKQAGEQRAARATILAAITPDEELIYRRIAPHAETKLLPLQPLPDLLRPPRLSVQTSGHPLHVFFMGASYNVAHNRSALRFLVDEVLPILRQRAPDTFILHILGSKVPDEFTRRTSNDLRFDGYVPDLDGHLAQMDAALAPSLAGVGMQQKVFEPICRAFPTITHARALAGYDFQAGVEVLTAESAEGYVEHLLALRDPDLRTRLSTNALHKAAQLFDQPQMDARLQDILANATA